MKRLEQWLSRGRGLARSARAVLPGSARAHRPVRVVLRLNDVRLAPGLVRATGEPLSLEQWRNSIVLIHHWLGPTRITFAGGEPARSPHLEDLVRFANRLECPTHLITAGPLDQEAAEALIDRGLGALTVLVGGVDQGTHHAAVGGPLDEATSTLEAFQRARGNRSRPIQVFVGVPLTAASASSAAAVAGWARQAGADGVLGTLPLGSDAPAGAAQAVMALGRDNHTPKHLLDHLAGKSTRNHGGMRMELLGDGTVLVSSLIGPIGNVHDAQAKELWEAADEQIAAARNHPRPWDEVELVPERLFSER